MWAVTVWALTVWLRITVLLAVVVGTVWLVSGAGTGAFALACVGAVLVEAYVVRRLHREWTHQARSSWWSP